MSAHSCYHSLFPCLFIPCFHSRLSIRTSVLHAVFSGWRTQVAELSLQAISAPLYSCYHKISLHLLSWYTSASQGGTVELGSALARAGVNTDCRQSQKVALYLVCKLCEAEEHLDTGLNWLSVVGQHVLMNWQTQQKTQFRPLSCMHPHTQVQTVPLRYSLNQFPEFSLNMSKVFLLEDLCLH